MHDLKQAYKNRHEKKLLDLRFYFVKKLLMIQGSMVRKRE